VSPIRVLHVVEALGVGGGVENGIANLIAHLDATRFEHILCAVFHLGPQVERYPAERVRLVCLGQRQRRLSIQVGPLARLIRELRPSIVHSRNWGALEAVFAARLARVPAIHSEHGVEMDPAAEPRRRAWLRRAAFSMAQGVFAVSDQLRGMLTARTGFPADQIGVIRNGVDTARFRPDASARARFRAGLGIGEDEFCIGCVGRLNRIKDYPTLLRAAALFAASGAPWRVLIAGSGAEEQPLRQMAAGIPALAGRVSFLGTSNRIPDFLNAVDAYVLPSLCEGISNSLLEAMATGLPVIASETGGNPEVVAAESGLLFPVGDAAALARHLELLYASPELRRRLAREALRRVAEHFSLDAMTEKYDELYCRLAGRKESFARQQALEQRV
jgi:sugar transferase (PEP-CTERM/EpsH1 system associated)